MFLRTIVKVRVVITVVFERRDLNRLESVMTSAQFSQFAHSLKKTKQKKKQLFIR